MIARYVRCYNVNEKLSGEFQLSDKQFEFAKTLLPREAKDEHYSLCYPLTYDQVEKLEVKVKQGYLYFFESNIIDK